MHKLWVFLFLALLLVSHGGTSGAIPHLEEAHVHEIASSHHAHGATAVMLIEMEPYADGESPEESGHHGTVHSHGSVALFNNVVLADDSPASKTLLRPGEVSPLLGNTVAPPTQPPLA